MSGKLYRFAQVVWWIGALSLLVGGISWLAAVGTADEYTWEGDVEVVGNTATWNVTIKCNGRFWKTNGTVTRLQGAIVPAVKGAVRDAVAREIGSLN